MNAEIKPVYQFSNGVEVVWCETPEAAIMSSFISENTGVDIYGKYRSIGPETDKKKTIVKRIWGLYVENQLYRVAETKSQMEEALQKLKEVVKEIGDLKEGEEMSYSSLFGKSDLMKDPD